MPTTEEYHNQFMTNLKRRNPPQVAPVAAGGTPRLLSFLKAMSGTVPPVPVIPAQVKQTLPGIPELPKMPKQPKQRLFPFVGA